MVNSKKIIGVIPARYHSTRLPAKMLQLILGKPMIAHVYNRAKEAKLLDQLIVATDHQQIEDVCNKHNIPVVMTYREHHSGTSRLIEVAEKLSADLYINIQGDEPLISPDAIDELITSALTEKRYSITTFKKKILSDQDIINPNVVKVVTTIAGKALYFSRSPIPYSNHKSNVKCHYYKHIGLYAYSFMGLKLIKNMAESSLEKIENLEQLRFLEAGMEIKVIETDYEMISVDTMEDLRKVEKFLKKSAI